MVTRLLESSNVSARTWIKQSRPYRDFDNPPRALADAITEFGLANARLGYERDAYFFRVFEQEAVKAALPNAKFINCTGIVEELRVVKSDAEVALMERAARATEAGMTAGLAAVAVGASENDIAAEIYHAMLRAGSEWPAMAPFVASGWRGALGHATWEGRIIEKQDYVFLEVAGCVHRYHAAMMRTVAAARATCE